MEHTLALIEKAHEGDKAARDTLAEENMGLVWSMVRRFANRGVEMEDLCQIGSIGLLKAIDKFDPSFEVCFSTYAVPMIAGEIRRFLRDNNALRVSRSLRDAAYKAMQDREALEKQLSFVGWVEAGEVYRLCAERDISDSTIRRARIALDLKLLRVGKPPNQKIYWHRPELEPAAVAAEIINLNKQTQLPL